MNEPPDLQPPQRIALADPAPFLSAITTTPWFHLNLDVLDNVQMWALVAMCALARRQRRDTMRCDVYTRGESKAGRFAHAVGFAAARDGDAAPISEAGRTIAIQRVPVGQSASTIADQVAGLAVPSEEESESRGALAYVIDELLRNVLQHSQDPLGAIVGAQRMDPGKGGYRRATAQVCVADSGRGILESLRQFHSVESAEVALEKAIRPHISGTFPEGQTGSLNNAGLGLFFTTEMAKLTAGRFLLATRGAALFLSSDEDANTHQLEVLPPPGNGFPGTLAVFELPLEVVDRDALLDVIRQRATERTPAAATRTWLSYDEPPADAKFFRIGDWNSGQDGPQALAEQLRQTLTSGRSVTLDFSGVGIATQSSLHALLFHGIRVAWALGTRIYVLHAAAAVRSGLDYLESYALK